MTQPTMLFIGPDGTRFEGSLKVRLRALLYTTAKRGIVVENMHVTLSHGESRITYPVWVLGEERLSRGGGIVVGEQGVIADHHFLLTADSGSSEFASGDYTIEVFAKIVGQPRRVSLFRTVLTITDLQAMALKTANTGIHFDWRPESQKFLSHYETKVPQKLPPEIAASLKATLVEGADRAEKTK